MATEERDHTADWIVPAERRPPSAFDLQRQVDVAMAVARAAEEAAIEIGQASLEAAEQARIAAVHAERSAEASVALARAAASGQVEAPSVAMPETETASEPDDPAPGHEVIPGSELPAGWSPVAPPPAKPAPEPVAETFAPAPNGSDPAPATVRPARPTAQPDLFDERMIAFRDRAERVMARFRALEPSS